MDNDIESHLPVDPCELEWPDVLKRNYINHDTIVGIISETDDPDPDICVINPLSNYSPDAPTSVSIACIKESNARSFKTKIQSHSSLTRISDTLKIVV